MEKQLIFFICLIFLLFSCSLGENNDSNSITSILFDKDNANKNTSVGYSPNQENVNRQTKEFEIINELIALSSLEKKVIVAPPLNFKVSKLPKTEINIQGYLIKLVENKRFRLTQNNKKVFFYEYDYESYGSSKNQSVMLNIKKEENGCIQIKWCINEGVYIGNQCTNELKPLLLISKSEIESFKRAMLFAPRYDLVTHFIADDIRIFENKIYKDLNESLYKEKELVETKTGTGVVISVKRVKKDSSFIVLSMPSFYQKPIIKDYSYFKLSPESNKYFSYQQKFAVLISDDEGRKENKRRLTDFLSNL